MRLQVTGLNHRNTPVELREQVAIPPDELPRTLERLRAHPHVQEAMILSTCNRVELFVIYGEQVPDLAKFLTERFPVSEGELRAHLYQYRDTEAVRHLFRVASSLDSMVVGEPQILGQVKEAFAVAHAAGVVGRDLQVLLQSAFSVAKRVRTETAIGSSSVSIASVAVDLALKIFSSLAGKRVLLVGAGKMGELAARHLLARGAGSMVVSNRTTARAERLAQTFGGKVLPYKELQAQADQADIVITSTGSHEYVFRREDGQRFLSRRRGRPMFFIDISVPRNIDPEIKGVEGVFLYDIDDLQSFAVDNLADRSREGAKAERLIEAEVETFIRRSHVVDAVPTLVALQGSVEAMRQAELRRFAGQLEGMTPAQRGVIEALSRGLANKFLHAPIQALRAAAQGGDEERIALLRNTFHLPELVESDALSEILEVKHADPKRVPEAPVNEPVDESEHAIPVARRR